MRKIDLIGTALVHDDAALARLRPLGEAARGYVQASRAERTRAAYQQQWSAFQAWCAEHALDPLPAAAETVALYVTARAQAGRKVATLAQALAAIGQAHRLSGHTSPRASVLVRETMQGIRRTHGSAPAQKAPILGGQLRAMLQTLSRPSRLLGDARDRALLLVGFTGALRRSELIALTISDLTFSSEGVTLSVRRSKTDQEGQGRKVGLPHGNQAATCPVRSLRAWLELASITEGPIFRSVDRHGNLGQPLSGRDVARVVQRTARYAGFDAQKYAGHSLRAGLATSAAKAGKSTHAIMKTTGHRSVAMVHKYIRDAQLFDDNAAAGLL